MKEVIHLPRKYNILLLSVWITLIILIVVFFTYKYIESENQLKLVRAKEIRGNITQLKDIERGSYCIEIDDSITHTKISFELPISFEVEKYGIHVNDFASKGPNSDKMTIYKLKDGAYQKCCEVDVHLHY